MRTSRVNAGSDLACRRAPFGPQKPTESEWALTCFRGDLLRSQASPSGRQSRVRKDSPRPRGSQVSSGRADVLAPDGSVLWRDTHPSSLRQRHREGRHRVAERAPAHRGRKLFKTYGFRRYAQKF